MADLSARWADLWTAGMEQIWHRYLTAQDAIRDYGRQVVGQTPARVIATEGRARLLHYTPLMPSRCAVPVLCVPSLINRYYVMDLTPERSLVRYLLAQGLDVYMLDWGTATEIDAHRPLDEYIVGMLRRAVQTVQRESGQRAISLLGYCMGGLMTAAYTVLYPRDVATLINLAGPINYHDDGIYSLWTRPDWLDVDLMVDTMGNIPAGLLYITFQMVRPTDDLIQALNYWERRDDESYMRAFAAMQLWTSDPTPFPGEAFRKYVKDLYQQNLLLQGRFTIGGQVIDLSRITAPVLTIAARHDHIAPWQSVAVFDELVGSADKTLIVLDGGHIGMVIGSDAQIRLWPRLGAWLVERSG